jgi:hypothetical protein
MQQALTRRLAPPLNDYDVFFAAFAFAAFLRLLRIMTKERKEPTTAEPRRMRMTGMRIAQTRGGKRAWSGWSSSTNGCESLLATD